MSDDDHKEIISELKMMQKDIRDILIEQAVMKTKLTIYCVGLSFAISLFMPIFIKKLGF